MKHVLLFLAIGFCALTASATAQYNHCGDFNGDSLTTVADIVAGVQYLFEGGTPPADFDLADFDRCQKYTFRDQVYLLNCTFACDFFDTQCPPVNPPFAPSLDSSKRIGYPISVPKGRSHYAINLTFDTHNGLQAYCLPMRLRINGAVPTIDSVIFPYIAPTQPYAFAKSYIDAANGAITMVALGNQNGSPYHHFARIFVTVPPLPIEQAISFEWATQTPIQAPASQGDAVFAFAVDRSTLQEFSPVLMPICCNLAGDVDQNGVVNISDVIRYLCLIFAGCSDDICVPEWDVNKSGNFSISDPIFLLNYIFAGGPAPHCEQ